MQIIKNRRNGNGFLRPVHAKRFTLLLIGNICNVLLAIYGIVFSHKDFAQYLLSILLMNLGLYAVFYIIMKVRIVSLKKNTQDRLRIF